MIKLIDKFLPEILQVILWLLVSAVLAGVCSGSEIRLPMRAVAVTPEAVPVLTLEPVDTIGLDELYVVESAHELLCLSSPPGLITSKRLPANSTCWGRFAGGTGIEIRTFPGPFVYAIIPATSGKAELIVVPVGVTAESEIERVMLTVSGPRPPPEPEPDVDPEPEPQPVAKNVSIAIVEDTMNRTVGTAILMNSLVAWTEFVDAGNDWRAYDKSTKEANGINAVAELGFVLPGIVIRDKATGKVIHKGDLPATIEGLKALVGRLTGG